MPTANILSVNMSVIISLSIHICAVTVKIIAPALFIEKKIQNLKKIFLY